MRPRAVIVDDHVLVAEALAKFLEPLCEVIGLYPDPRAFLRDAAVLLPEIVILDLSLPFMSGLETTTRLRQLVPAARVIIVTMTEDPDVANEALGRGAAGFVLKRSAPSELPAAIRAVLDQRTYVTPLLDSSLTGRRPPARRPDRTARPLTARQREVLRLLAAGHSMKEAGALLNLSPRTVAFHKYRLMERLRVDSTAALVRFAVKEGLL
jgi:DNA-binding NarL/FixJ family response regulator